MVMALLPGGRIRSLHLWERERKKKSFVFCCFPNLLACLFAQFPPENNVHLSLEKGKAQSRRFFLLCLHPSAGSVLVVQVYSPFPSVDTRTKFENHGASSVSIGQADRRWFVLNHHLLLHILDDVEALSLWQRPVANLASHAPSTSARLGWNAFPGHRHHCHTHALYPLEYHQPHVSFFFVSYSSIDSLCQFGATGLVFLSNAKMRVV